MSDQNKSRYYNTIKDQLSYLADDIDRQISLIVRDNGDQFVPPEINVKEFVIKLKVNVVKAAESEA